MAYSYEIRFSTGAYAELLPSNQLELVGGWEVGTMIWREKIGEVKIGRLKNSTIYDTLESWFDDDTKFATRINIKILKDSVEESVHWFGVKWGSINEYQKTYTITPIPYDLWGQYFESTKDVISTDKVGPINVSMRYYGATGTYETINQNFVNGAYLEQITKDLSSFASGWATGDVVSSFVWQSPYEDTSAVGTYQGMPKDYVTGEGSPLTFGGIKWKALKYLDGRSFTDLLEWYKLIRTYVYFDSNDKLRFEHIKFFNDKLTDNAVDYSSLMKSSDERFSYSDPQITVKEKVEMSTEEDDVDPDFVASDIIYSDVINRPDAQVIDHISNLYSNLGFYGTGLITDELILFGGFENQVHTWFDIDMTTFSSVGNAFDIVWDTGGGNDFCGSNDIWVFSALQAYDFIAEITAISGTMDVYLKDRSSGAAISNKITVNSTGTTTGTITSTAPAQDGYLAIEGTVGATGSAEGWISASGGTYPMIPTIDGFTSGTPKTNGAMSVANIIDKWWRDDRLSRTATFNSTGYAATSTIFNLARDTINVYYKGGLSDVSKWFLPSQDELNEMYTNLHLFGVGGFQNFNYWSSSEISAIQSRGLAFSSGLPAFAGKTSTFYVRACRSFTDTAGEYSLRDTGPAGGLIFYISGTTYYEAAPSDQSISQAWSNITATLIGTTGTAIGTGEGNTTAIIDQVGHTDSAAKLCNDLAVGLGGDINPLFGWNDGTRIAKIDKWTRNLKTGYYQIDLIYQEDD